MQARALFVFCSLMVSGLASGHHQSFTPPREPSFQSFMPRNELHKFDSVDLNSNVPEDAFNLIIERAEKIYKPLVKEAHGADLTVIRKWNDPTVNAYASQSGKSWRVTMFGGLARRPEITPDGFALVLCHEIGHHLAGFPFVSGPMANEGQSDYFATLACGRELWRDDLDNNAEHSETIPAYPKALCDKAWSTKETRELCYRMAEGGKSLADLLSLKRAKYETPDKKVVSRTNNDHPAGQCRLDTYLAGAVCTKTFDNKVIPSTEREVMVSSCLQTAQFKLGFRPRCWYKPAFLTAE